MKSELRCSLHQSSSKLREESPGKHSREWAPELRVSDLKPLVAQLAEAGLSAVDTPGVTETTKRALQSDGKLAVVRSPEVQLQVR